MAAKTRYAEWRKIGRLFYVRPPGWPKNVELSFTERDDMLAWARVAHVMLRETGRRREYA